MTLKILVTNDDGIDAPGLKIAEQIAKQIAGETGEVITVAPAVDQSGVGHSISYLRPSLITKQSDTRYSVEGSPADCVLAGVYNVMNGNKPNLILAGINNGHNLAEDVLYSGTVGAAMEGALQGIRSIAMSQCYTKESQLFDDSFETARHLGANICSKLITESDWDVEADNIFYNVNFPAVRVAEVAGLRACIQGRRSVGSFSMDSIKSPNGRTFLMVNHRPSNLAVETDKSYKTDLDEIKNNYVTITPLKTNLTELNYLGKLKNMLKNEY